MEKLWRLSEGSNNVREVAAGDVMAGEDGIEVDAVVVVAE